MMNGFYFTLKSLIVLKVFIYIFVLTYSSCKKNGLIKKIRLISKFKTSQPRKLTITMHILLSNISISKGNQIMKFGQLIE